MSEIRVNNIVSETGDSAPSFPQGLSVTGVITATSFSGDGSGITNAGSSLSAASGTQRIVLTSQTTGTMTASSTDSNLTYDQSTGTLSATYLSGDGSNITNAGSTLSAASGTQRVVLTNQTSGSMTATATDASLTYNQNNNTLDANISGIASITSEWTIGADAGNTYYTFTGPGFDSTEQNPTITLQKGQKYKITNNLGAHPLRIQTDQNGSVGTQYNDGISANDVDNGTIEWDVQMDTPGTLYYQCTAHAAMGGKIIIGTESGGLTDLYLATGGEMVGDRTAIVVGFATDPNMEDKHRFRIGTDIGGTNTYMGCGIQTGSRIDAHGTTAGYNTFIGYSVQGERLGPSSQSKGMTLVGALAGNNINYSGATCIGYEAVTRYLGGLYCTAVGYQSGAVAGAVATAYSYCTSVGYRSGYQISNAYFNPVTTLGGAICIGSNAGGSSVVDSGKQVIIGEEAAFGGVDRYYNILIGARVGYNGVGGMFNTIIGSLASDANKMTGSYNTIIGGGAGDGCTAGTRCTILGFGADASSSTASDEVTLGNANVTSLRCAVTSITAISDRRDKTNIEDIPVGLNYINALRPVKFDWAKRDGSLKGKKSFGFIAQELEEVQSQFGYREYSNLVYNTNPEKLEASPMNTYPILVKAVQELSAKIDQLETRLDEMVGL